MRTVILGGGFGGLATATELRRRLGEEHEIVVVDRGDRFLMGFRKLWGLVGLEGGLEAGSRPLAALEGRRIGFRHASVEAIHGAERRVETDAGELEADFLVVALGAEPRGDAVSGLREHAVNLYDPASIPDAAARVAAFREGRVVVGIAGLPYKCPPAPYEASMLLEEHFRGRGDAEGVEVAVTTPLPVPLPPAGPAGNEWLTGELSRRRIRCETGREIVAVEAGRLRFAGGGSDGGGGTDREESASLAFDLALLVPPHRPPAAVAESDLAGEGGWIRPDPRTLATGHERVWAIGDCVHIPLGERAALPKAGLFADGEGRVVAAAIAAEATGGESPEPFDGRGACFLETGAGEAALLEGRFYAEGGPDVRLQEPSAEHARRKRRLESERLTEWFGG